MKKFKKEIGDSIISYINKLRVYNSLSELNHTNNSIVLISINNGFNSLEYYSEMFKKIIGISPSKYRKLNLFKDNNFIDVEIQGNIIELYSFISKVREYKKNRKPKGNPVLIRSIFIYILNIFISLIVLLGNYSKELRFSISTLEIDSNLLVILSVVILIFSTSLFTVSILLDSLFQRSLYLENSMPSLFNSC